MLRFVCVCVCVSTESNPANATYFSTPYTWNDALTYCMNHSLVLAFFNTPSQISAVVKLISGYTWISLLQIENWKWIDAPNIFTIPWSPGLPQNLWNGCAYLSNNMAYVSDCSAVKPFYCLYSKFRNYSLFGCQCFNTYIYTCIYIFVFKIQLMFVFWITFSS